ncbi:unnamed protein product [Calypogeia fissa]
MGFLSSGPDAAEEGAQPASKRHGVQRLSESVCASQYAASLKCLEINDFDKSKCQDYFDAYKGCRKQEREMRLEANRKSKRFF